MEDTGVIVDESIMESGLISGLWAVEHVWGA